MHHSWSDLEFPIHPYKWAVSDLPMFAGKGRVCLWKMLRTCSRNPSRVRLTRKLARRSRWELVARRVRRRIVGWNLWRSIWKVRVRCDCCWSLWRSVRPPEDISNRVLTKHQFTHGNTRTVSITTGEISKSMGDVRFSNILTPFAGADSSVGTVDQLVGTDKQ